MWRLSSSWLGVLLAVTSAANAADSADTIDDHRAQACKILLEAQAAAHEITSPSDRTSALTAIAQALIRAGDENGALAIDKKVTTGEIPRPILKSLALAQLRCGRVDDALFTVRTMNDQEASDVTLFALAHAADDAGDAEMAVRLCKLVGGETRLDALLLATRIQHNVANLEGAGASLDAAKLLAHHQAEVAKVAETEALIGNLDRANRLMARLRRESDQSRVLAAMITIEAAAKDFASAESHASDISVDSYKSTALGTIALAHADAGQIKEAIEQMNAISDDDVRITFTRTLMTRELKSHGVDAGRTMALAVHDVATRAVCLSVVATVSSKSGNVEAAKKTVLEAQALLFPEHELSSDLALAAVAENMGAMDMSKEAITLAEKIRDADLRTDTVGHVLRAATRLHDGAASRTMIEPLKDVRERAAGLTGIADGLLDVAGAGENPS